MPSLPGLGTKPWKDTLEAWLFVGHNTDGTLKSDTAKADVASAVMDGDAAGGALDGTYPSPGLAASVAGNGLAEAANVLSVNVDGSTLEIAGDSLQVKNGGITAAKVAADVATQAELDAHTGLATGAHAATAISSAATGDVAATTVQAAIAELAAEKQAVSAKGQANGYASLDASSLVPDAQIPAAITRDSEMTTALGSYQLLAGKGAVNGYASLDGSGLVPDAQIPAAIARDAEVTAAVSAHTGLAAGAHAATAISSTATGDVAATTVQAAIAELASEKATVASLASYQALSAKGVANGYASLDTGGVVPDAQIPAAIARDAEVTSAISTHAGLADPHTGYQQESEKGAVNGYAPLDGTSKVPIANLPAMSGGGVDYIGTWGAGTAYKKGDVVRHNGIDYLAVNDSTGQTPPPAVLTWQKLTQAEYDALTPKNPATLYVIVG